MHIYEKWAGEFKSGKIFDLRMKDQLPDSVLNWGQIDSSVTVQSKNFKEISYGNLKYIEIYNILAFICKL